MWDMPWTDSETLIDSRLGEELLKRNYGDREIKFPLPINWIDEIDIFDNFRLQDPFAPDTAGIGDFGRYYYITSITYDFMNDRLNIIAKDLEFIMRQCMILGDCDSIPATWAAASYEQRLYGYLCNCDLNKFESDGSPCKVLCPCEL